MPVETLVELRCSECGDTYTLSARRARAWRDREPLCRRCQIPPRELSDAERVRYRRWWLERSGLSRDELQELARTLWPDRASGQVVHVDNQRAAADTPTNT